MNIITERLSTLREKMLQNNVQAWIVPGTDPHMSEYLPPEWAERAYISGFTGSMGYIVITANDAGLWTDSRYFIQGETQLAGSGIRLFKKGVTGTPEPITWLCNNLSQGDTVGINGLVFSVSQVKEMQLELTEKGIRFNPFLDLLQELRETKSEFKKAMLLDTAYSGETTISKLERLRAAYTGNWMAIYSALDQIAWLFNIRGEDVSYNPVLVAYAVVTPKEAFLFTQPEKITDKDKTSLQKSGVTLLPYDSVFGFLSEQDPSINFIADTNTLNYAIYNTISGKHKLKHQPSLVNHFKSLKNDIELSGFKKAMVSDGIALLRFFMWFENALAKGKSITEYEIGLKLKHYRSQQEGFVGESFCTIASFNENGAIVHYSPPAEGSAVIKKDGILLIDSGGQYYYGTTDITRTISTGKIPQNAKNDFTHVLQGHIGLTTAVFPEGTTGVQLDILARDKMWKAGIDYGHGTGHGVGHFLNVHEGPQTIRKEGNNIVLRPGMVLTIEPGIYRANNWGLRVENMVYITHKTNTEFGSFLHFENLTLFPIDLRMINMNLLSIDEIEWINNYHKTVYNTLAHLLEPNELNWLKEKTRQI